MKLSECLYHTWEFEDCKYAKADTSFKRIRGAATESYVYRIACVPDPLIASHIVLISFELRVYVEGYVICGRFWRKEFHHGGPYPVVIISTNQKFGQQDKNEEIDGGEIGRSGRDSFTASHASALMSII